MYIMFNNCPNIKYMNDNIIPLAPYVIIKEAIENPKINPFIKSSIIFIIIPISDIPNIQISIMYPKLIPRLFLKVKKVFREF